MVNKIVIISYGNSYLTYGGDFLMYLNIDYVVHLKLT